MPSKEEQERVEAFMAGYEALVKEHHVDMYAYPVYVPTGSGRFELTIQATPVPQEGIKSPDEFIPKQ